MQRLAEELRRRGLENAAGAMHIPHRVLDADNLLAGFLHVVFSSPQAGKNQRLPARRQMRTIEFGRDVNC